MSKISLSDLAQRLAEKSGISLQDAELFIRKMFDVANEGLQSDKLVKMKWLGTFKVMAVKDRESVDVNTGERILIEGRDKISFTPDNILKEIVNKPFAQFETVVVNDGVDFDEIDRKFENAEEDGSVFDSTLECVPDSENSSVESFVEQDSPATSGVIDFLDEENDAPVSDEMIVIGERLSQENVAEPEEKKPEGSESAATEPAVFKPAVSEPVESESATSELETKESEVPAQNEVESVVSDEEKESILTEETPVAEKVPSAEENSITETPIAEKVPSGEDNSITETPITEIVPSGEDNSITEIPIVEDALVEEKASSDEETPSSDEETDKRHIVLPRSLVIAASVVFLAMIGGFGWFAFNYGKMAAQRDHLALQLDNYQQTLTEKKVPAKSALTQEEILRKKAIEDSVRMAQASEAVKKAENAEQNMDAAVDKQSIDVKSAEAKKNLEVKKLADAKNLADAKRQVDAKKLAETKKQQETKKLAEAKKKEETRKQTEKHAAQASSKYDQDARVRTGAYRIIGVSEVVTAREGQTIKSLSQKYLGPGMECYVEALNGNSLLKPGQKVKIPKLELKKKK
ncbi:HU family DNA-binding protein [Prevotella copri]|uniref:HU family DNA-binding protein n=1 Tax=Segatella copri TaxID=165179 RepID=A0AAW5ING3_9BACT|nr:HU family DNA-binding protein [Segatella copri]MCP9534270.1 HU family DNA-binding protein [Segatella copri]MCP9537724.1 HU family DNA-binding protein [Segatella copri]MCP9539786.1 HU family DNA-binding protein [Segatella copri]MCP9558936.1 HU family DNA-binding protein [Segatella copri]MCP9561660.1 HU family DNA-binding protein [Segatella copri]